MATWNWLGRRGRAKDAERANSTAKSRQEHGKEDLGQKKKKKKKKGKKQESNKLVRRTVMAERELLQEQKARG